MGDRLPTDYNTFADTYGAGQIGDILIGTPVADRDANLFNLLQRAESVANELLGHNRTEPFYPEQDGLITWGATFDNWLCCWAPMTSDPDQWATVVVSGDGGSFELFELSFSQFLQEYIVPTVIEIFFDREPQREPGPFVPL